jgi:hypothetical protein
LLQEELRFPLLRAVDRRRPSPWELPTVGGSAVCRWGVGVEGDFGPMWEQRVGVAGFAGLPRRCVLPRHALELHWTTNDFRRFQSGPSTQFIIGFNY